MAEKRTLLNLLGLGAARKAGEAITGRDKRLQEAEAEAVDGEEAKRRKARLSEQLGIKD